jgi:hypothetical protein
MAAAPVESCQSLPKRSLWGRLGSELYTCKRLHRIRRRFQQISANIYISQQCGPLNHELLGNGFQSSRGPQESAHAVQATTHYQTYPERPPGDDLAPKKVCNLDPMAPR